jgi:N-acetyl-anhydromuramyl-L-alanine amidase AmpD
LGLINETNLNFNGLTKQDKIKRIVLHHVGPPDRDVSAKEIDGWHKGQGWAGIGYHFVVRRDGTIERGRPEWALGAHAAGFNNSSIGINFAGNLEKMQPTKEQIEAGAMLLADLCTRHQLEPNAQTIVGHCDLMATACPGKNLYLLLQTLIGKAVWYQQNPCW